MHCLYVIEVSNENNNNPSKDLNTMEISKEDNLPGASEFYITQINDEEDLVQRLERLKVRNSLEARTPTFSKAKEEQYLYLFRKKYPSKDFH